MTVDVGERARHDIREWDDADGTTNLQPAVDSGEALLIPEGLRVTYEDRQLLVGDDTDIQVDGVVAFAGARTTGGTLASFVRTKGLDHRAPDPANPSKTIAAPVKSNRVNIHGTGTIRAVDPSYTGNLFAIYGDDVRLSGFTVSCWAGGRCIILDGDYGVAENLTLYGSPHATGNGGVRVVGGNYFTGRNLKVFSGDDALQFVTVGSPVDPLFDHSIHGGRYERCVGGSWAARWLAVVLSHDNDATLSMRGSITDVGFTDCDGFGGVCAMVVENVNSTGPIDGVTINGGSVDLLPQRDENRAARVAAGRAPDLPQDVLVWAQPGTGGVNNVVARRHRLRNPRSRKLLTVRGGTDVDMLESLTGVT